MKNKKNRELFQSIPSIITKGNFSKRVQEKQKIYKKGYKKIFPKLQGLRSEIEKVYETHNIIRLVTETFQTAGGRTEGPTSCQRGGEKSHKQRSRGQKGRSFLNSNPETRRQ